jgi:predicted small secreted protein
MKLIATLFLSLTLVGCGTIGGAVSGLGKDIGKLGEMISD